MKNSYLICQLTMSNHVRYYLPETESAVLLNYENFKTFLYNNFKINQSEKFIRALNSFQVLFLDQNGDYEELKNNKTSPTTALLNKLKDSNKEQKQQNCNSPFALAYQQNKMVLNKMDQIQKLLRSE